MPEMPSAAPLTPAQIETARRDLTELTGGAWYAQAAAWAGPLLATVLALQAQLDKARIAAREGLLLKMEQISEEYWRAGWYSGLESILWRDVTTFRDGAGTRHVTPDDAQLLADLADLASGWWVWEASPTHQCPVFISLNEWVERYVEST